MPAQFREAPYQPLLALQHPLHPAQVRGNLGRTELRFAGRELALDLGELGPDRADDLQSRAAFASDLLGQEGDP